MSIVMTHEREREIKRGKSAEKIDSSQTMSHSEVVTFEGKIFIFSQNIWRLKLIKWKSSNRIQIQNEKFHHYNEDKKWNLKSLDAESIPIISMDVGNKVHWTSEQTPSSRVFRVRIDNSANDDATSKYTC